MGAIGAFSIDAGEVGGMKKLFNQSSHDLSETMRALVKPSKPMVLRQRADEMSDRWLEALDHTMWVKSGIGSGLSA